MGEFEYTYSTSSFWVSIVSIGIGHFPAIKSGVGLVSGDGHRFDFFRLVGPLFQHDWAFGFVGFGRSVTVMRRRSITRKIKWI